MSKQVERLITILICIIMIIPNYTFAQDNNDFKSSREKTQIMNWVIFNINQILQSDNAVITLEKPGTYEYGSFNGTIIIAEENIILKNTDIMGNLIIKDNLRNSKIQFENVNIFGILKICAKNGKIKLKGNCNKLLISANNVNINLLDGFIENLIVSESGRNSTINLPRNTVINNIIFETKTDVKGKGIIKKAIVKANGVKIEQIPEVVEKENGIFVYTGYDWDKSRSKDSNNNESSDSEIVAQIKKDLELEIINPVGRKKIPNIILPVSDNLGYKSNIIWQSDNTDFIIINGSSAIIYRRGVNNSDEHDSEDGGCKNDDNSNEQGDDEYGNGESNCENQSITDAISIESLGVFNTTGCDSNHDDSGSTEECGGTGGNINVVTLTAIITKGHAIDTKTFNVNIPWGWGKAVTLGNNGSNDHCHTEHKPVPNNIPDKTLYLGQYPLIMTSEDIALYGGKIIDVSYDVIEVSTGSAINYDFDESNTTTTEGGIVIEPIDVTTRSSIINISEPEDNTTGSGIIEYEILDNKLLKITPVQKGQLLLRAEVENSLGKAEVSFKIIVKDPAIVDDTKAVTETAGNLKLSLLTKGHDSNQINKLILPDTDSYGYGTSIDWNSNNEEFLSVTDDIGTINRRGRNDHGGCDHETVVIDQSVLNLLGCSDNEEGHDEGDCGGNTGGGKSTNVELKATISRGEEKYIKNITVRIPWGWGKEITLVY